LMQFSVTTKVIELFLRGNLAFCHGRGVLRE
jgi:hypothetical protein